MSSEFLICPQCKTTLNKPVQYQVLGDVARSGGSFIALGSGEDALPCAVCGFRMSKKDIVAGKFDPGAGSAGASIIGSLIVLAVIGFVVYKCST